MSTNLFPLLLGSQQIASAKLLSKGWWGWWGVWGKKIRDTSAKLELELGLGLPK